MPRDKELGEQDQDTTTPEQRLAMQLILEYFKIKSGFGYGKIARGAHIPAGKVEGKTRDAGRHVNNFRNQGTCPYVMRLKAYFESQVSKHEAFRNPPQYIINLIEVMKGTSVTRDQLPEISHLVDDVFLNVIEEGNGWKQRILEIYGGAWFIIRYAAGVLPGSQPVDATPGEPLTLYSIMEVQSSNPYLSSDLPSFTVHYRPWRDPGHELPSIIHGHILSLRGGTEMMFIGYEDESAFPLVIGAIQGKARQRPPKAFPGFVLRRFEQGAFVCGYCRFVRADKTAAEILSDKELRRIGIMTRSEIIERLQKVIPNIAEIMDELRKSAENDGTSMLKL